MREKKKKLNTYLEKSLIKRKQRKPVRWQYKLYVVFFYVFKFDIFFERKEFSGLIRKQLDVLSVWFHYAPQKDHVRSVT